MKTLTNIVDEDFESMHNFLNEIQIRTLGVDPSILMDFIRPLKNMIFEAWLDTSNSEDPFLFKNIKNG